MIERMSSLKDKHKAQKAELEVAAKKEASKRSRSKRVIKGRRKSKKQK